jgi:alanyl-tRNA synthetase
LRWLTDELGIDPDEITLIEDVWAGGGNMGPSIEYFVGGLELGNMVFMQVRGTLVPRLQAPPFVSPFHPAPQKMCYRLLEQS